MRKGTFLTRTKQLDGKKMVDFLLEVNGTFINHQGIEYFIYKSEYQTWHLVDTKIGIALDSTNTKKALLEGIQATHDKTMEFETNFSKRYDTLIAEYGKLKEERK